MCTWSSSEGSCRIPRVIGAESQEGSSCNLVSHGFRCRSVVVSDTHHKPPACDLLEDAGIARFFPKNLTSVEHGRREPCPSAYQHALSITGGRADTGLFVRDSYEHDYAGLRAVGLHDPLIDRAGTRLIPDDIGSRTFSTCANASSSDPQPLDVQAGLARERPTRPAADSTLRLTNLRQPPDALGSSTLDQKEKAMPGPRRGPGWTMPKQRSARVIMKQQSGNRFERWLGADVDGGVSLREERTGRWIYAGVLGLLTLSLVWGPADTISSRLALVWYLGLSVMLVPLSWILAHVVDDRRSLASWSASIGALLAGVVILVGLGQVRMGDAFGVTGPLGLWLVSVVLFGLAQVLVVRQWQAFGAHVRDLLATPFGAREPAPVTHVMVNVTTPHPPTAGRRQPSHDEVPERRDVA